MITLLRIAGSPSATALDSATPGIDAFLPPSISSCRTSTGRGAVAHLIKVLSLSPTDTVLLPAYVPEGIIQPFLSGGIGIKFYRLHANLTPALDDVQHLLETDPKIRLIVAIHSFGFESEIEPLRELVDTFGAFLLEDCAHALFTRHRSGGPIGAAGHFALFSLNKFLPVPDGAVLLSHVSSVDVTIDAGSAEPADREAIRHYLNHLELNRELFDCPDPRTACALLQASNRAYDEYYGRINSDLSPRSQSAMSRELELQLDCAPLIERRKSNASYLYRHLNSPNIGLVFPDYNSDTVCCAVPALVKKGHRDRLLRQLFERNIMLSTLIDRWDFIPRDVGDRYACERSFLDDHVLLPVSEFLTPADMEYLVRELNRFGSL